MERRGRIAVWKRLWRVDRFYWGYDGRWRDKFPREETGLDLETPLILRAPCRVSEGSRLYQLVRAPTGYKLFGKLANLVLREQF